MASVPSTPKTPRVVKRSSARSTPRSVRRTIHNLDPNGSYVEEDDATYVEDTLDESSDDDLEDESLLAIKEEAVEETNEVESSESIILAQPTRFRQFLVDHEVARKLLHSSIGVFTLWLYTLGVNQKQLIIPLSTLFAVIFTNDYIRLQSPELNKKIVRWWWWLVRESEVDSYNGTLWYLVGLVLVFAVMPKDISLMAVLLLSWSDTSASTVGRAFGKYTPQVAKGKSLAGCVASFFSGIFSCYVLYAYFVPVYAKVNVPGDILWTPETSRLSLPVYAVISGLVASVSEGINLWGIDDNFTIPVLSGVALYGVAKCAEIA